MTMIIGTLALTACGGGNSKESKSKKSGVVTSEESENIVLPDYSVKINGTTTSVKAGSPLEAPANPTAPAGKKFLGWKNVKNGGQIWDFEDEILNKVMEDVELEPCFVDANQEAQLLEAELCPEVPTLAGNTYSGANYGKGLVLTDFNDEYNVTTIKTPFDYYETDEGLLELDDPTADLFYFEKDIPNPLPEGKTLDDYPIKTRKTFTPVHGAFIHYNYIENNTLTWEIESSEAATNVQLFARFSGEYGHESTVENVPETLFTFTDTMFPITVNEVPLQYGAITIHNVISKSFIPFQDFEISATVSLNKGTNKIQMKVANSVTIFGSVTSTAPCIDSVKLYSPTTITWNKYLATNIVPED